MSDIGLLHSLTGTMSISEKALLEAELLAIKEINSKGGVLGQKINYFIEDGASSPEIFIEKAEKLICHNNVVSLFGGWNSHVRKALKSVVEAHNNLLWYPIQYEGLEESKNIFYFGSCLNQQVMPMLDWCWNQGFRKYFLIGSDYLFPVIANKLIISILKHKDGIVSGEEYFKLGNKDFDDVLTRINDKKPDVIINTLNGDSNLYFFDTFNQMGFSSSDIPVISTSIAEKEFLELGEIGLGHYSCCSYFQKIQNEKNKAFIKNFRKEYGSDRVVSDPIVMAYSQVYFWKKLVEKAKSFNVNNLVESAFRLSIDSPAGKITMLSNHHTAKNTFVGKAVAPGEFEIVWESKKQIEPLPWLGIEQLNFTSSYLIKEIVSQYPEILNFNKELEVKINEKTRWLQTRKEEYESLYEEYKELNEQLRFASYKASESNLLKKEFINNISHEIRTPLNGILGFSSQFTREDLTHEKKQRFNNMIQESSSRLLRIIDEIMEMSALETNKVVVNKEWISIRNLLVKLYKKYKDKALKKDLIFKTPYFPLDEKKYIFTDFRKLERVLSIILDNAVKYTVSGGVQLGYLLKEGENKLKTVEFFINDTGPGINTYNRENIFDMFSRKEEKSADQSGLGLGLAIAKEYIELLGGDIHFVSKAGQGTNFYITIPENISIQDSENTYKDLLPVNGSILLVEDDNNTCLNVEVLIASANKRINVIRAINNREAKLIINRGDSAVKLMLTNYPDTEEEIKELSEIKSADKQLPLIAMTSDTKSVEIVLNRIKLFDDYIEKPLREPSLKKLMDKYFPANSYDIHARN